MSLIMRSVAQNTSLASLAMRSQTFVSQSMFKNRRIMIATNNSVTFGFPFLNMIPCQATATSSLASIKLLPSLFDITVWWIKRTFQPSIIRKKRKTGFLVRQRTVGGRRTLNRRRHKGRMRLGGGI
ncbi:hypothetical protein MPSEU_000933800 [Mayamaea pseudoterrestris]|nr:hypothetical protein MPSEU_000933800 [Mayamaea pseudoterrestris]